LLETTFRYGAAVMEKVLTILAAALIAGTAAAEPPKSAAAKPGETKTQPGEVAFAAAGTSHAPAPETQPNAAPAKRRVARVTTCRCGDPQADPDSREQ
jgi:hypothetical protein